MSILKALVKSEEKNKIRNFKAKDSEIKAIERNAKKYAGGNVSHWIRHAAMNHVPSKKDLK